MTKVPDFQDLYLPLSVSGTRKRPVPGLDLRYLALWETPWFETASKDVSAKRFVSSWMN